jgi:WD40 repeat protein
MNNPFPGPQPYRASDRERFFGRSDVAYKLQGSILANRCVTVYGPSGAGKSSLLQASVFPSLAERHDARVARVDAWPEGEDPTRWLATTLFDAVGFVELPPDTPPRDVVLATAKAAARASSRLLVIYLDQLEQLLYVGRTTQETQPLFDCVEALVDLPLRNIRVVLSLREDYLGRFRDRSRDLRRITDNGFRVGPLDVTALSEAVLLAAAAGEPPQAWDADEIRSLMLQVRVPGQDATEEAEAQSAYAQIICRALFQERALGKTVDVREAEPILRGYLASTLAELGELRDEAQKLLEDHLVGADGSRTLRTETELGKLVGEAVIPTILRQLEAAAILRAEEHHGSRYFEIGHDWLAAWVVEQRKQREQLAEQKRLEEEQARRLAEARTQQRRLKRIAAVALGIAALVAAAAVVAIIARSQAITAQREAEVARRSAEAAEKKAAEERDEANDLRVMAGYRAEENAGNTASAMKLLATVKKPEHRDDWIAEANRALQTNALFVTLRGHRGALRAAHFSPDGKRLLTASDDHTARLWNADGTGEPLVLGEHRGAVTAAVFSPKESPEGQRILTISADGTARSWLAQGDAATSILLGAAPDGGATAEVTCGAFSPDGQRVALASLVTEPVDPKAPGDKAKKKVRVRIYAATDGALLGEHGEHRGRVRELVFLDETHLMSVADDGEALVWDSAKKGRAAKVPGHEKAVLFVAVNREKSLLVTTYADGKARVFGLGAGARLKPRATLEGHTREVLHAAISADGKFVATASADRTARVWNIDKPITKGAEVVLSKHDGPVTFVSFRSTDPRLVATASSDQRGRIFSVDAPDEPHILAGHAAPVQSIEWNPEGNRLVTAALDERRGAAADHAARIWNTDAEGRAPRRLRSSPSTGASSKRVLRVAAFAEGREILAAAFDDGTVELREARGDGATITFALPKSGRSGVVTAAVPSPDGERVAIATLDVESGARALYVYSRSEPKKPLDSREAPAAIRQLAWSRAGDRLAAALEDGTAIVVRVGSDAPPVVHRGHTRWLTSVAFDPAGKKLVTTSLDKTALVFDVEGKGEPIARFEHPDAVNAATFDPTGRRLATTCADGAFRIFELGSANKKGWTPFAEGRNAQRLTWSADGTRIAASEDHGGIWVLSRTASPEEHYATSPLHLGHAAAALSFVDGGHRLVAVDQDQTYAWELDIRRLTSEISRGNRDCLDVVSRGVYLNETSVIAEKAYHDCEIEHRRAPPSKRDEPIDTTAPVVARVLVFPGGAEIEVNGAPAALHDGFLELRGKPGETKKVRVIDGALSTEAEVTIDASGAKPPIIVLDIHRAAGGSNEANAVGKPGEFDFDAIVPKAFQ